MVDDHPGPCAGPRPDSGRSFAVRSGGEPETAFGVSGSDEVHRLFYRWGGALSSTLVRLRQRFEGDLDQYLLAQVFLQAEFSQTLASPGSGSSGDGAATRPRRGMNALSLADITRIPRETARRKLQILAAGGYVARGEDGLYYLGLRYGLDAYLCDLGPLFRGDARNR